MDARTSMPETTDIPEMGGPDSGEKLSAYGRARRQRDRRRKMIRGTIGVFTLRAVWQIMSVAYVLQQILPPPLAVARTIFSTLTLNYEHRWLYGPNIYEHLASSFVSAVSGFAVAGAFPIPGIAWIPLAILWFGLGNTAVIFVVFIAEFFPLYFNTEAGARSINPILVDAARCFGAQRLTLLRRVSLPTSIPYIITGMRIALGGAWRMIVAGDMLASQSGIGSVLMEARFQFRATDLMMAMILISVVGYATERLIVGTLEKKTTEKWEVKIL